MNSIQILGSMFIYNCNHLWILVVVFTIMQNYIFLLRQKQWSKINHSSLYQIIIVFIFCRICRWSSSWKTMLNSAMISSRAKSIERLVPDMELARGPCDNLVIPLANNVYLHNTVFIMWTFSYLLHFDINNGKQYFLSFLIKSIVEQWCNF